MIHSNRLIKHGAVLMLASLFGGFFLGFALTGGIGLSPLPFFIEADVGDMDAWRRMHSGAMMNGVMAVAIGLAMRHLQFAGNGAAIVSWGTMAALYGNLCFYVFSVLAPNRGLGIGDNIQGEGNIFGALAYLPALVGAIGLIWALIVYLRTPIRQD